MKPLDIWRGDVTRPRTMLKTVDAMLRDFDSFFDDMEKSWRRESSEMTVMTPSCDIEENDKCYLLSFDLPGFKKEDINIDLAGNTLTVSGKRHSEKREEGKGTLHRIERHRGEFRRVFTLPDNIKKENWEAGYENGVLYVMIPKMEVERPRHIEISEGKKEGFFKHLVGGKSETEAAKS